MTIRIKAISATRSRGLWLAGVAAVATFCGASAHAQVSTATLSGVIRSGATAISGASVGVTNVDNGRKYQAQSAADGGFTIAGLPPGTYQVEINGAGLSSSDRVTLHVAENAGLDVDLAARAASGSALETVTVIGTRHYQKQTAEVGTIVTQSQIRNLPQVTRNFLAFADLAPGVRFDVDQATGNVKMQSGAQNQDNVNVFIDGVSQKNYVLRGGIAGMDSSRGNPFPQSAVAEYRVIAQNYKAEYDQVSSAAITAVTRSGSNEFRGDVFVDRTGDNWIALSPFEQQNAAAGVSRPPFHQEQFGFSVGGPIMQDKAHFFFSYEGKDITAPHELVLQNANLLPSGGIVPQLLALQGSNTAKFKEHLLFAKIDAQLADNQAFELSATLRRENDYVPEDNTLSVSDNFKDRSNDETRIDLKHTLSLGSWLNEARIDYENSDWKPQGRGNSAQITYQVSTSHPQDPSSVVDVVRVGSSPDAQDRAQKGVLFQDDLTFTGRANHTFKAGAKVNFVAFDLAGTPQRVAVQRVLIDNVTGAAARIIQSDPAIPPVTVNTRDTQFGVYFQDDWQATSRLLLSLGVRWDYENNMLNNAYVTPADRVTALLDSLEPVDASGFSTRVGSGEYPVTPGQTYAQSLAKGGVNIANYIADGHSRKPFTGAFAPRLGFSYDLRDDKSYALFGGAGRAYDRTMANNALDELQSNLAPNGQIWLIRNDFKMPYTDQLTLGLRQNLGAWNNEIGLTSSRSHNQFNWFEGNRDPLGGWDHQSPIDPLWDGPPGYGNLTLGDFISEAKTSTAYLKLEKPYTEASRWGATLVYTYSDAMTTNKEWTNDIFNWTYGKPGAYGWHPSTDVERNRIVASAMTDRLPFGIMASAKVTYGSGHPYQVTECAAGWDQCQYHEGKGSGFRQVDLGWSKSFAINRASIQVRLDVLNLLNTVNYGGFDGWGGGPSTPPQNIYGGDNPNVGKPSSIDGPMRTFKIGLSGSF